MRRGRALILAAAVVAACTGTIGDEEGDHPFELDDGAGTNTAHDPSWVPQPEGSCEAPSVSLASARRLTASQYRQAVEALTGELPLSAPSMEPEPLRGFADDLDRLAVSPGLVEAYLEDAELAAATLVREGGAAALAPCAAEPTLDRACAGTLLETLGQRAFRRPLTSDELDDLLATFDDELLISDAETALELAISRVLLSPHFLYRIELGQPVDGGERILSAYELATRLAFLYTGAPPDAQLLDRADSGGLDTPEDIATAAQALVFDSQGEPRPQAKAQLRRYLAGWLGLRALDELSSDLLEPSLMTSLRAETDAFLDEVVWEKRGGVSDLLSAGFTFVDAELAEHYQIAGVTGSELQLVADPKRIGLLTQGAFSLIASRGLSDSVVTRGVFITEQFSCVHYPDPPESAMEVNDAMPADLDPKGQAAYRAEVPGCANCHALIDPPGVGMLDYGPLGEWRASYPDGGSVDASSSLSGFDYAGDISGAAELSQSLAESEHVRACASAWMFRFAYSRVPQKADGCHVAEIAARADSIVEQWLALSTLAPFRTVVIAEEKP